MDIPNLGYRNSVSGEQRGEESPSWKFRTLGYCFRKRDWVFGLSLYGHGVTVTDATSGPIRGETNDRSRPVVVGRPFLLLLTPPV